MEGFLCAHPEHDVPTQHGERQILVSLSHESLHMSVEFKIQLQNTQSVKKQK